MKYIKKFNGVKKGIIIGVLISVFMSGCQDLKPVEKPEGLIDEAQMEEILMDLALVNAARGFNPQMLIRNRVEPEKYIYDKYGIDSLQFAQSTIYYGAQVEKYRTFLTTVQHRLDSLHSHYDSLNRIDKKHKDSIKKARAEASKKTLDSIRKNRGDSLRNTVPERIQPRVIEQSIDLQQQNDG